MCKLSIRHAFVILLIVCCIQGGTLSPPNLSSGDDQTQTILNHLRGFNTVQSRTPYLFYEPARAFNLQACIDALSDIKDVEGFVDQFAVTLAALIGNLVTLVLSLIDCSEDFPNAFQMMDCFIDTLEASGPNTKEFLNMFYNLTVIAQQVYGEVDGDVKQCFGVIP